MPVMSSVSSAVQIRNVKEVFDRLRQIVQNEQSPSLAIQNAEMLLEKHYGANETLMKARFLKQLTNANSKTEKNIAVQQGTTAAYLTFRDIVERRKAIKIEQEREQQRKAEQKRFKQEERDLQKQREAEAKRLREGKTERKRIGPTKSTVKGVRSTAVLDAPLEDTSSMCMNGASFRNEFATSPFEPLPGASQITK